MFRKAPPVYSNGCFMPRVCRIGWDSVVCIHGFFTIWFQREHYGALLAVTIMGHPFSPMVKLAGGGCDGSRDLGTINDELTLCGDVEGLVFCVLEQRLRKWGRQHRKYSKSYLRG
jgi:hypothetical protein